MNDYKEDVRSTRTGAFGSSDGKMLMQIAELGYVPKSAYKRMAVCKGLCEVQEIPYTAAVRTGDEIELALFNHIKATNPLAESNPLVVSRKYARKNFHLLSHPDIRIKDDDKKILTYIECKASRYTTEQVRGEYVSQLYIHSLIADEEARSFGKGWKSRVMLAHFNTEGLNLEEGVEFDPERLTVRLVRLPKELFDINKALDIVDEFLDNMTEFYENESIDANALPEKVYNQFSEVATFLREIKEREVKIEAFKARLYDFLTERGISRVACDEFSFTVVAPTQQTTFDHKKYLDDFAKEHPKKAKKIKEKYKKTTNKKGYVVIKTSSNKE